MSDSIIRNGISKALSVFKIVKGDNKDKEYLAPVISVETWSQDAEWIGVPNIVNVLQTYLKRTYQSIYFDNVDENGVFNKDKFLAEAADFTSTGMKLKEINEQLDELQAKQGIIFQQAELGADGLFVNPNDVAAMREIAKNIQILRAMKEARSRKKAEVEPEAAVAV